MELLNFTGCMCYLNDGPAGWRVAMVTICLVLYILYSTGKGSLGNAFMIRAARNIPAYVNITENMAVSVIIMTYRSHYMRQKGKHWNFRAAI